MADYNFSGVDKIQDDLKYDDIGQQAIAGAEGLARGVSIGGSDWAERALGVPAEDIAGRARVNPMTSGIGNIIGTGAIIYGTGGLAAPIEGAIGATTAGAKIGTAALGMGIEGGLLSGAQTAISDSALGDPSLNAQKIATSAGLGFLFGAGAGAISRGLQLSGVFRAREASSGEIKGPGSLEEHIQGSPEGTIVEDTNVPKYGIDKTSLEDMAARNKDASYRGESVDLPEGRALEEAASRVELDNPVHKLQSDSLANAEARDLYRTAKEMPGEEGEILRNHEALQKQELNKRTDNSIKEIAPEHEPIADATKGGEHAVDAFTEQYRSEKKKLAPLFEELKTLEQGEGSDHLAPVIENFVQKLPEVSNMFELSAAEETAGIKPYQSKMGIDKSTYTAVKEAVESLKEPVTAQDLVNIRKGLSQNIDLTSAGEAAGQIRSLKAGMMDYIQGHIDNLADLSDNPIKIRDIMKRYAINEQERGVIEKTFGASVGSPEYGVLSRVKPEQVGDKIFSNTANIKAARNILGDKKFNEVLANYLAEQREKFTVDGVFSSNKFGSFLKRNAAELREAFAKSPDKLQKIKDYNTISRILPDAKSINPSGTAKTLFGTLKAHSLLDFASNIKEFGGDKFKEILMRKELNEYLKGESSKINSLRTIKNSADKVTEKIESAAKSIFTEKNIRSLIPTGVKIMNDNEYNKVTKKIKNLAMDMNHMMDTMSADTDHLNEVAPNITQGLNATMVAGMNFLNSKIPQQAGGFVLSGESKPSVAQIQKFSNYYNVVDNPLTIFHQLKDNSISGDSIEALNVVYPQLYADMKQKVINNFDIEKAKKLDFASKISLAKFLGQPLDEHMTPQAIVGYQTAYLHPNMQEMNPGMARPSAKGMEKFDKAGRSATLTAREEDT